MIQFGKRNGLHCGGSLHEIMLAMQGMVFGRRLAATYDCLEEASDARCPVACLRAVMPIIRQRFSCFMPRAISVDSSRFPSPTDNIIALLRYYNLTLAFSNTI